MVLDQATGEADQLHTEIPGNPVRAMASVPTADRSWEVNAGDGLELERHGDCILGGLPSQRSLSEVQEVKMKPNEDLPEFLDWIFKAYRQYTGIDPEAPPNLKMANITLIGQSTPDIQRK